MNYDWIENYALGKIGVYKVFKEEWNAYLYMIDNKYFIMQTKDKEGRDIITFKLEEAVNLNLRKEYPEMIVPGYYSNKKLWSSVYFDQNPPKELLQDLINQSYEVLLNSFPKKRQLEIKEGLL